jgi:hypothetical protein
MSRLTQSVWKNIFKTGCHSSSGPNWGAHVRRPRYPSKSISSGMAKYVLQKDTCQASRTTCQLTSFCLSQTEQPHLPHHTPGHQRQVCAAQEACWPNLGICARRRKGIRCAGRVVEVLFHSCPSPPPTLHRRICAGNTLLPHGTRRG